MENYIVSARKYRPTTFESVVGQQALTQTLRNAIRSNRLAHAYLFCGPRGVGKTTCARIFAKTINCLHPTSDHEACNQCESCTAFNAQRSFNIHELDAASNNSVEDIRSLIDQVRIPPQIGKYSVYIIDEVHMLSQAAFNAFLKTLEEPPAHAIFILATTEKHKILPTILSRCQTYDFNRITVDNIVKNLRMVASSEGVTIDDESLHVVAHKADGAMRDALTIFDQTVAFCGTDVKYQDVLRNLKKEKTLIMATHNIDAVSELADRVVFMDKGRVCEEGTVEDVLNRPQNEATKRFMSRMKQLHYVIESPDFDHPELNARIEQYCNRFGLGTRAFHFTQLAVEETLNIIPLDKGVQLILSKSEQEVRMNLDITVEDMGVAYTDPSTCKDELSLSLIQGLCDVLEERVVGDKRVLHLELNKESLLK